MRDTAEGANDEARGTRKQLVRFSASDIFTKLHPKSGANPNKSNYLVMTSQSIQTRTSARAASPLSFAK